MNNVMNHNTTVSILRALGDEVRLGMVRAFAHERRAISSCDIVSSCSSLTKLSQPTMSHHFHKLVEAGVLIESKDGVAKHYQLNRPLLKSVGIDINKL
jgi:DNA-binding transcriptional ArsR family regulator